MLRPGSDPILLAQAVRDTFGLDHLYLADLDAIANDHPAFDLYRRLADLGLTIWVDAGMTDGTNAGDVLATGVARVVIGLETVRGPATLRKLVETFGPSRVVFSLDLRDGLPILAAEADWEMADPLGIASEAVECGVDTIILLDLARVGTGRGVGTLPLLDQLSGEFPGLTWVAGGGIAGRADIETLRKAGASAVLVASALHDGRLSRDLGFDAT